MSKPPSRIAMLKAANAVSKMQHLKAEAERARIRQEWAWEHAAELYRERDLLVRALSLIYPSHLMHHKGHNSGNRKPVVCIHSPAGQLAWTITTPEMQAQFSHLEWAENDWDGHKVADRYARLAALTGSPTCLP